MLMLGRKPVSPLCMPYAGFEKATNCILEIPQNIKVTLENNVLTLKAGSKCLLYGSTYQTVSRGTNLTRVLPTSNARTLVIMPNVNLTYIGFLDLSHITSGESFPIDLPSSGQYGFYKVSEKRLYETEDGGTTWTASNRTYPICVINIDSDGVASFAKDSNGNDMIFNGAGFIGHHAFVYPGVEALAPDGFNSDGSYKSAELTNNALRIIEMTTTTSEAGYEKILQMGNTGVYNSNNYREVESYNDLGTQNYSFQYVKKDNIIYYYNGATYETRIIVKILSYSYDGTTITDFAIQQPLTKYRWVVKLIP